MIAKIVIARKISTIAMSVYSLTLPTLSLILTIAQLGIPTTVSKLIAKQKYSIFKIMQVSLIILLLLDLIIGVIYIFLVPYIAQTYLKNPLTYPTLYGMVLLLPLVSLTSLIKGYFIGINQMQKTNICQISEELARLLFIIVFVDLIDKNNISFLSFFAMFSTIVGEIASLIHLLLYINIKSKNVNKRIKISNENNSKISKNIISISLMNTSTRLVGSLIYFLEPIVFTYLMLKQNIDINTLTLEYGTINSYVFPLILLPSFFANGISMFMLSPLSSSIEKKQYNKAKNIFFKYSLLSFILGLTCIIFIYIFPSFFTSILYGKTIGIEYIKKYSLIMSIYFLQSPFHISLVSFDKEKSLLIESIICNLFKIILFFVLIPIFQTDGMVISIILSVILSISIQSINLFKAFRILKNESQRVINV